MGLDHQPTSILPMAHQCHVPLYLHHSISIGIITAFHEPLSCESPSHPTAFLCHLLHLCKLPCAGFPVDVKASPPENKDTANSRRTRYDTGVRRHCQLSAEVWA
uniref:Uncharacterized protein n=1 Tax=Arundo donax TaxID=35708 RepID=A0A0A8ZNR0_ARUDO